MIGKVVCSQITEVDRKPVYMCSVLEVVITCIILVVRHSGPGAACLVCS